MAAASDAERARLEKQVAEQRAAGEARAAEARRAMEQEQARAREALRSMEAANAQLEAKIQSKGDEMARVEAEKKEKEAVVFFSLPGQLGAVGEAIMCGAIDDAETFIDAATMEEMEGEIDKEEMKRKVMKGEITPCRAEDAYYIFPRDKKKK